jgi:hypothetical protein
VFNAWGAPRRQGSDAREVVMMTLMHEQARHQSSQAAAVNKRPRLADTLKQVRSEPPAHPLHHTRLSRIPA